MDYSTEEYKGYTIKVEYDEDPQNPRTDWDSAGTMVC
jgi:ribulose bisphosphate carboxylase small subunit